MRAQARWRVAVIGGHERARDALGEALRAAGAVVVGTAATAADGLDLVRATGPDVAVVALWLPDGDGLDVAAAIGRDCAVVLHGPTMEAARLSRACEAGAMAFLARPVGPGALAPTLGLAVARFAEARDLRLRLEERKLVERAKGLLMRREGLTENEAFGRLRRAAMDSRRPLAAVARDVVHAETLA